MLRGTNELGIERETIIVLEKLTSNSNMNVCTEMISETRRLRYTKINFLRIEVKTSTGISSVFLNLIFLLLLFPPY